MEHVIHRKFFSRSHSLNLCLAITLSNLVGRNAHQKVAYQQDPVLRDLVSVAHVSQVIFIINQSVLAQSALQAPL